MKEPALLKPLGIRGLAVVLALFVTLPLAAQTAGGMQDETKARALKQDIVRFEVVVNEAINGFSKGPFGVVQRAKGAYLPGYGVSFACLINIHLAIVQTPFGQVSRYETTPEMKKQAIEELKNEMIRLFQGNGRGFQQLNKEDTVSITVFIEDRNIPDEPGANKTIVLSVLKKDLDELAQRNGRLNEFKQRVNVVEY